METVKLYSLDEVCKILNVCYSTGRKLRDQIPGAVRLGGRTKWTEDGIQRFIKSCEVR
jgi:hypothetical protein